MSMMLQGQPPKVAVILGALGLFPFLSLGAIAVAGPTIYIDDARVALLAYGAVILSFLGRYALGAIVSLEPMVNLHQTQSDCSAASHPPS